MRKVWVVSANSGNAKIFRADNSKKLTEIKSFEHPEIHLSEKDLLSDRPGVAISNHFSHFGPHSMERQTSQKTKERNHFAEEIALFLEEGYKKGEFERLYVIANLPFIGFLHEALSNNVSKLVHGEVQKDLMLFTPEEIRGYLPEIL